MLRIAVLLLSMLPALAAAHAGSKSWLTLQVQGTQLEGQLVTSVLDAALALQLDVRNAPEILRPQILARREELLTYLARGLVVLANGERQPLAFSDLTAGMQSDEAVLVVALRSTAAARIDALDVGYTLFFEDDVLHECLARVRWESGAPEDTVFRLGEPLRHMQRGAGATPGFVQFLRSGIWHIWTGYDHVLFLLALLLPAVLQPARSAWREARPAPGLPAALLRVMTIVTAFTLAHSITLICASLGLVQLPARLVEAAIALSVFIAAASNLLPAAAVAGPWMAFAFGLLHGFGFSSVLAGLIPASAGLWRPLLAFNLGVEVGQLAIVAVFFPLAWLLRGTRFYATVIVRCGSIIVCACALLWFGTRAF